MELETSLPQYNICNCTV